jgi:hypothetical protein
MNIVRSAVVAAALLVVPIVSQAGPVVYYLNTGQTTAQPSIDTADETDWYGTSLGAPVVNGIAFTSTASSALDRLSFVLGGGNFDMKEGSGTVGSITLSLWQGGLAGTEVAWVTWTAAEFCAYKASVSDGCQQLVAAHPVPLYFTDNHTAPAALFPSDAGATGVVTPYTLDSNFSYIDILTSDASTAGNVQYFIKGPTDLTVANSAGDPLAPSVPEPGTWLLTLAGGLALPIAARLKRA